MSDKLNTAENIETLARWVGYKSNLAGWWLKAGDKAGELLFNPFANDAQGVWDFEVVKQALVKRVGHINLDLWWDFPIGEKPIQYATCGIQSDRPKKDEDVHEGPLAERYAVISAVLALPVWAATITMMRKERTEEDPYVELNGDQIDCLLALHERVEELKLRRSETVAMCAQLEAENRRLKEHVNGVKP